MNSELESESKAVQKPNLRRRLKLSFWLLFLLVAIIGWRVYLVRWPTDGPTWNDLTVGQSTTDDVHATLGWPYWVSSRRMSETVYHYEDKKGESWKNPTIYFRNDRVIRIRVFNVQEGITVLDFVERYGKPDHITEEIALNIRSPNTTKGVYWSDEGIYVSVMFPDTGNLTYISYFRPCPLVDIFCIMAEKSAFSGPTVPGEDVWGIMSPLPIPTLTPTPDSGVSIIN